MRQGQRIAVKGDLSNVQFRREEMAHFPRRQDADGVEFRIEGRCAGGVPTVTPTVIPTVPPPARGPRKGRLLQRTEPAVRQSLGPAFLHGDHAAGGIIAEAAGVVPVLDPRAVAAHLEEGRGAAERGVGMR